MLPKTIQYKNIAVSYTDQGKGNTIVLLHGFLENQKMWNTFVPHLTLKNRVITIDLLGHGGTDCLGYVHTMEDMAACVNFIISSLGIKKINLVGHSMGGYVALAFAELFPQKTRAILLLNSTEKEDNPERKINRNRAIEAVKTNRELFIQIAIANLFNPENNERLAFEIANIKHEALQTPLQGVLAAITGMKLRKERSAIISRSGLPVVIVAGEKDPILPFENIKDQHFTSNVTLKILPDGHMSFVENPNEVLGILLQFSKIK